ncbi:hypothetical protein TraAM80_09761, partial [Trypanosoma rangeli]
MPLFFFVCVCACALAHGCCCLALLWQWEVDGVCVSVVHESASLPDGMLCARPSPRGGEESGENGEKVMCRAQSHPQLITVILSGRTAARRCQCSEVDGRKNTETIN